MYSDSARTSTPLERAALAVPLGEVAQVGPVRASGRLGDPGRGEEALDLAAQASLASSSRRRYDRLPMDDRFHALAELAVHGANVQPGQVVAVGATTGQEELARAVAKAAYVRGALFVDVAYFDPYVKRARIEHADPETLDVRAAVVRLRIEQLARARRRPHRAGRRRRPGRASTVSTRRCSAATSFPA